MKYQPRNFLNLIGLSVFSILVMAVSNDTVQNLDRMKLDWEDLTVQFYGVATPGQTSPTQEDPKIFKTLEKKAWNEGLAYIRDAAKEFRIKESAPEQFASTIGARVARATYSYDTEYYRDGSVQVKLASSLVNLVALNKPSFSTVKKPDISGLPNSGIILKVAGAATPSATYTIVDEKGAVLFQPSSVSEESFQQHLMGHWFTARRASPRRVKSYVGDKPLEIKAKFIEREKIAINRKVWEEALKKQLPLLVSSRVAIVIEQ